MSAKTARPFLALAALVGVVLLLVVGIWLGGHPDHLPSFMRNTTFQADHRTEVVDEAIQKVSDTYYRPVGERSLLTASIEGMAASLKDPYTTYLSPTALHGFDQPETFTGIGVEVTPARDGLVIQRVFDKSPAERSGLQMGETITGVNGRSLKGVSTTKATGLITGPPGTSVGLTLTHGRHSRSVSVVRAMISEPVVDSSVYTVHHIKLGWVYLSTFSEGSASQVRQAVRGVLAKGVKGIVFDLRDNGGGLVSEARLIASTFIESGVIVTTKGRTIKTDVLTAAHDAIAPTIPMVVLVDRYTASASEIVTAALQDHHRATVVGTHTFGKGVFQELEPLANGGAIKVTVGEYYTPDGRNLGGGGVKEGAGITPEVRVSHGIDTNHGLTVALDTLAAKVK